MNRLTLCGFSVADVPHPDHKLRQSTICSRCDKLQNLQPENTEHVFTKTGKRRHYQQRVVTI